MLALSAMSAKVCPALCCQMQQVFILQEPFSNYIYLHCKKFIVVLQSPADIFQTKGSETVITVIFPQLICKYLSKMSSISTIPFSPRHKN